MGYPILEITTAKPKSELSDSNQIEVETEFSDKSRWLSCVAFTISALTVIITAMSVGMFIGYSYCYFEHRSQLLEKNYTRLGTYEIIDASSTMTESPSNVNRTINGAIKQAVMSSILVSKIYNMVHQLAADAIPLEPDGQVISMTNLWDMLPEESIVTL